MAKVSYSPDNKYCQVHPQSLHTLRTQPVWLPCIVHKVAMEPFGTPASASYLQKATSSVVQSSPSMGLRKNANRKCCPSTAMAWKSSLSLERLPPVMEKVSTRCPHLLSSLPQVWTFRARIRLALGPSPSLEILHLCQLLLDQLHHKASRVESKCKKSRGKKWILRIQGIQRKTHSYRS